jgi:hypothetical protein
VITAAAVCPHPPLLFRELSGQQDAVGDLRAACQAVVRTLTGGDPDVVVVVGGADAAGAWDSTLAPEVRGFGATGPKDLSDLPLSLGVGRRLLQEAGWSGAVELVSIGWDAAAADVEKVAQSLVSREGNVALLLLGEGSTRRGETAPGYLDDRAFAFDDATGRALETGDPQALLDMDAHLARDLMACGRAAFQVLGAAVENLGVAPRASMAYRDDPYGVMYFVALWRLTV